MKKTQQKHTFVRHQLYIIHFNVSRETYNLQYHYNYKQIYLKNNQLNNDIKNSNKILTMFHVKH